jgi:hypothetical protein
MKPRKRPNPKQGARGTPVTRKTQRYIANHLHELTKTLTQDQAASATGLSGNDVKNMRAGHMPSLRSFVNVVKVMRVTPESLMRDGSLAPLSQGARTAGAKLELILDRISKICKENDAAKLAKQTGIPKACIYQLRTHNARVGLHVFLAFVSAGYPASELLFGSKPKVVGSTRKAR